VHERDATEAALEGSKKVVIGPRPWPRIFEEPLGTIGVGRFFHSADGAVPNFLFIFIVMQYDRRRIVHFNVAAHPTAQWRAQQILEGRCAISLRQLFVVPPSVSSFGMESTRADGRCCATIRLTQNSVRLFAGGNV
jgi:hypothetical protein